MRRQFLCVAAVVLVASVASVRADTSTWDAYSDFSSTSNTASDTWQYMRAEASGTNGGYSRFGTYQNNAYYGMMWTNGADEGIQTVGGQMGATPGNGPASVIAWMAPQNLVGNTVDVSFSVTEISTQPDSDTIPRDGMDYHLFVDGNATELAGGYVAGMGTTGTINVPGIAITPGQKLYLQFGMGTVNYWYDHAGADFTVTGEVAVPEPSAMILLSCGLLSLLAYAWRKRK